jgi:hypothetical protein
LGFLECNEVLDSYWVSRKVLFLIDDAEFPLGYDGTVLTTDDSALVVKKIRHFKALLNGFNGILFRPPLPTFFVADVPRFSNQAIQAFGKVAFGFVWKYDTGLVV